MGLFNSQTQRHMINVCTFTFVKIVCFHTLMCEQRWLLKATLSNPHRSPVPLLFFFAIGTIIEIDVWFCWKLMSVFIVCLQNISTQQLLNMNGFVRFWRIKKSIQNKLVNIPILIFEASTNYPRIYYAMYSRFHVIRTLLSWIIALSIRKYTWHALSPMAQPIDF